MYYVAIEVDNGCGCYVQKYLKGDTDKGVVIRSFSHPKVTNVSGSDLSAYKFEEDVAKALIKHFKAYGYNEIDIDTVTVAD